MKSFYQFCSISFTLAMKNLGFVPVANFILDCKIASHPFSNSKTKLKLQNYNSALTYSYSTVRQS